MQLNTLAITAEFLSLIGEIDEFKGAWRALGTLAPERLSRLRRVATVESVGSSTRIEGSTLSDPEVAQLLSNLEIQSFSTREEQEVAGYAEVMDLIFESYSEIQVTENHVQQLHGILLKHCEDDAWHRGRYKKNPNNVVAFDENGNSLGVVFQTVSPFDTPRRMTEWATWLAAQAETREWHPLVVTGVAIVVFLEIHPFQDGNGRLSRVLTTLMLLRFGYAYVPYSSLESIVEQNMEAYYLALRQTQGTLRSDTPDWQPWLRFFLDALVRQTRRLADKVEREHTLVTPLPELSRHILEFVREHGRITMGEAIRVTGSNRDLLKRRFRTLVDEGHLEIHGQGRGAWYELAVPRGPASN